MVVRDFAFALAAVLAAVWVFLLKASWAQAESLTDVGRILVVALPILCVGLIIFGMKAGSRRSPPR